MAMSPVIARDSCGPPSVGVFVCDVDPVAPGPRIAVQPAHLLQTAHLQSFNSPTLQYINPGSSAAHRHVIVSV